VTVENTERSNEDGTLEKAEIIVTVKKVNTISLSDVGRYFQATDKVKPPNEALQALDIVLRSAGTNR
jgi:hypothetical protein